MKGRDYIMGGDIDMQPFPNVGNNVFYKNEFAIGAMLPSQTGSTEGFDTPLGKKDIVDVIATDDDKIIKDNALNLYVSETSRSKLPDDVFGIPEIRKYPMPDKRHVLSAIKFFNYAEDKYEEELAKNIISNMEKYNIDKNVVGDKNKLKKYLSELATENVNERNTDMSEDILEIMKQSYFSESTEGGDPEVPDTIEPYTRQLEAKGYKVKYASPGYSNTRFDNDRNKDGVINAKLVTTGRIIFSRDYKFRTTPRGWVWKILSNGAKALYVKQFTYNEKNGTPKQAFEKWKEFYLNSLKEWISELPMCGEEPAEYKADENF
jgi:uncharacterized protein YktA (UPF0223 family)